MNNLLSSKNMEGLYGALLLLSALTLGVVGIDATKPPLGWLSWGLMVGSSLGWCVYLAIVVRQGRRRPMTEGPRWQGDIPALIHGNPGVVTVIHYPIYGQSCVVEALPPDGRRLVAEDAHYFAALLKLRRELESRGVMLQCWGALRDVWPSGMQADMGCGLVAHRRSDGDSGAELPESRGIFEPLREGESAVTADEQEQHSLALIEARLAVLRAGRRPDNN